MFNPVSHRKVDGYSRALISRGDLHDAVCINLERHLDLWNTTRRGRNTRKLKFAEEIVVLGERTFTFKDLDQHRRLVVSGGREAVYEDEQLRRPGSYKYHSHLALFGGNNGVTGNEFGEHAASGLDTECKRADIDKKDASGTLGTRKNTTLYGGTICDGLVRVDSLRGFLAIEEILEELLHLGNPSRTANKDDLYTGRLVRLRWNCIEPNHLIDILLLDIGVLENLLDWFHCLPEEIHVEFFEFGSRKCL